MYCLCVDVMSPRQIPMDILMSLANKLSCIIIKGCRTGGSGSHLCWSLVCWQNWLRLRGCFHCLVCWQNWLRLRDVFTVLCVDRIHGDGGRGGSWGESVAWCLPVSALWCWVCRQTFTDSRTYAYLHTCRHTTIHHSCMDPTQFLIHIAWALLTSWRWSHILMLSLLRNTTSGTYHSSLTVGHCVCDCIFEVKWTSHEQHLMTAKLLTLKAFVSTWS